MGSTTDLASMNTENKVKESPGGAAHTSPSTPGTPGLGPATAPPAASSTMAGRAADMRERILAHARQAQTRGACAPVSRPVGMGERRAAGGGMALPGAPPPRRRNLGMSLPGAAPDGADGSASQSSTSNPQSSSSQSGSTSGAGAVPAGSGMGSVGVGNARSDSQPRAAPTNLFASYKKYLDIKTGSLSFAGKAALHSKGIDFSNGTSFRISLDELVPMEELGAGNYGTVTKVLHKPTNVLMAMKEIRLELDEQAFRQIIMELDVLHRADPYNIVEFYGAFFVESSVYVCMEYMDGGSINKIYTGGIPEDELAFIIHSIILALKTLKEQYKIIHRDVKPTNILCSTDGKIKLCDFGVSGNLVASIAKTNVGCQAYMAPERIRTGGSTYTVESDIWSLGLSAIEMASGSYPYSQEAFTNIFSQLTAIVDGNAPELDKTKYSPDACSFVAKCLEKQANKRPSYGELLDHPWLKNRDFTNVDMGGFVKRRVEEAAARDAAKLHAQAVASAANAQNTVVGATNAVGASLSRQASSVSVRRSASGASHTSTTATSSATTPGSPPPVPSAPCDGDISDSDSLEMHDSDSSGGNHSRRSFPGFGE